MNTERYQPSDKYKKFLLNRVTTTNNVVKYVENCLVTGDEAAKYSLHKIMIHNWPDNLSQLFDTIMTYFSTSFVPVNYVVQGDLTSFYVENMSLVSKIIKFDFMFPYSRNMFSVDILLNDKTSLELFGNLECIEDIVSCVVSKRFDQNCELDLSNFCNDPEFVSKKLCFYKLPLLASFKILMLRMGRDTKSLNLSNNNLNQTPVEILNFFIKADLTAVNLSHNNIPTISDLLRLSSKIEKLWIEGNPLCEDIDPVAYIKTVVTKFPRITELDGVKLNENGVIPYIRNYMSNPGDENKAIVDMFLTLYFTNYDSKNRQANIRPFYDDGATLTISCKLGRYQTQPDKRLTKYISYARNILPYTPTKQINAKCHITGYVIAMILGSLPESVHDPTTFTVDVLIQDGKSLMLIVDGVFKHATGKQRVIGFRRTFIFKQICTKTEGNTKFLITNEMVTLDFANDELIENSFKSPMRNLNSLVLINPTPDEVESICQVLQHITQLQRSEVELRLKYHSWDIKATLKEIINDLKSNKIMPELFLEDDFSDMSSLLDEIY